MVCFTHGSGVSIVEFELVHIDLEALTMAKTSSWYLSHFTEKYMCIDYVSQHLQFRSNTGELPTFSTKLAHSRQNVCSNSCFKHGRQVVQQEQNSKAYPTLIQLILH